MCSRLAWDNKSGTCVVVQSRSILYVIHMMANCIKACGMALASFIMRMVRAMKASGSTMSKVERSVLACIVLSLYKRRVQQTAVSTQTYITRCVAVPLGHTLLYRIAESVSPPGE